MTEPKPLDLPREAFEGHERTDLPLERILVDTAFNIDPRRSQDPNIVNPMVDDIRDKGLLQPLVVLAELDPKSPGGIRFKLLAGFVRYEALRRLGYKVAPVVVKRNLNVLQTLLVNGAENLRRKNVHPFYICRHFKILRDVHGMSVEDISKTYGYELHYTANLIRTYERTLPEIRDEFFHNLDVDETRIPAYAWILDNAKRTPEEQKEAYEAKYGKGRDTRALEEADEGEPEVRPERKQRPRRRSLDEMIKAIGLLTPADGKTDCPVEIVLEAFKDNPKFTKRERILVKAALYWASDSRKACPWRKVKAAPAPKPKADDDGLTGELEDA